MNCVSVSDKKYDRMYIILETGRILIVIKLLNIVREFAGLLLYLVL